jgi:hypothetical protein
VLYPNARRANAAMLAIPAFFTKLARCFSFNSCMSSSSVFSITSEVDVGGGGGLYGVILSENGRNNGRDMMDSAKR